MASIDGKEKHDAFNSRMKGKQPPTTQASAKNSPSIQKQLQALSKGKGKEPARDTEAQGFRRMPLKMYFRWQEQRWNFRKRRKQVQNIRNDF
ncbi:hypothetical protein O181_034306 [Austropuccinia psidii MF-1]|uniref:Uncharacterized protein n=1 Tax=Austropuccinia psidii MF-1 TaxID=1389203 RepID=A0A9Q3H7W5_9BASI|nr:hypothetical protein [Austropuccinia psidii MF-1]